MKITRFGTTIRNHHIVLVITLLTSALRADQVQMQNGDRYFGKITALNTNALILQSDVLGIVQLPRNKVAAILLGTNLMNSAHATSNIVAAILPATATTNTTLEAPDSLRQLAAHTNLIQQVQSRFLADAGPETNAKFTELMAGLTTGKLNIDDLKAEAKKSVDQVRELKRGLGEDESSSIDVYLSILDKFLKETPAPAGSSATRPAPKPPINTGKADE